MTPRTKMLFSVNESIGMSPQKDLQSVNAMMLSAALQQQQQHSPQKTPLHTTAAHKRLFVPTPTAAVATGALELSPSKRVLEIITPFFFFFFFVYENNQNRYIWTRRRCHHSKAPWSPVRVLLLRQRRRRRRRKSDEPPKIYRISFDCVFLFPRCPKFINCNTSLLPPPLPVHVHSEPCACNDYLLIVLFSKFPGWITS